MAKYSRQKLKLFYLRDFLLRSSDEEHRLTIRDMIAHLASHDISAERKSLYSDLNLLQEYGMDIVRTPKGYYVGSRGFELPELKLLVDSVLQVHHPQKDRHPHPQAGISGQRP